MDEDMPDHNLKIILLGAGGHAKVVLDTICASGLVVYGIACPDLKHQRQNQWRGYPVLGDDNDVLQFNPNDVVLANGIGSLPGQLSRTSVFEKFKIAGFRFITLIHPFSFIGSGVDLKEGVQVMAGVTVQADCSIGENAIINTHASIDHDTLVGAHTHIAPGVITSGNVSFGEGCHIGTGASVIHGVHIGNYSVIGAATVVLGDVPDRSIVTGQPPKPIRKLGSE